MTVFHKYLNIDHLTIRKFRKLKMNKKSALLITLLTLSISTLFTMTQRNADWWEQAVFYEIFVRSFYDSDGDGIGDLQGVIQKLDYLNDGDPDTHTDLGIDGIWLMPIFPSPSYHGYDVQDYWNIESDYGTLDDFSALVDSAHARGIKVIIDFVMNHSSSQNPWFQSSVQDESSPYREWYVWEDNYPGYYGPWGQQVWYAANGDWYFGLFWSGMPDFNWYNQSVRDEFWSITEYWLNEQLVDGFRLDAICYLTENGQQFYSVPETFNVLEEFNQVYKSANPEAMTVGEVWVGTGEAIPYVQEGRLDMCFEFDLASAIIQGVEYHQTSSVRNMINDVLDDWPVGGFASFLTNHDQDRVFTVLNENQDAMKLAAAVYLTLPGTPFIYYGEEVGMTGSGADENKRTPMQWSWTTNAGFTTGDPWYPVNNNYLQYNVQNEDGNPESILSCYRYYIQLRQHFPALSHGYYADISTTSANLYSYARILDSSMAIMLHNFHLYDYEDVALTMAGSALEGGNYQVLDASADTLVTSININDEGGFEDWVLPGSSSPFSSRVVLVQPLTGDLDLDGRLDILDIVLLVYCILNQDDCPGGDLNQDDLVDVTDILMMISEILDT